MTAWGILLIIAAVAVAITAVWWMVENKRPFTVAFLQAVPMMILAFVLLSAGSVFILA